MRYKINPKFISLVIFGSLLVLWYLFASSGKVAFFFGTPQKTWQALVSNTFNLVLPQHLAITTFEIVFGFVIGTILGTLCGFGVWYSKLVAAVARPFIVIAGTIPIFTLAPIIILWFGVGIGMKCVLAGFGTFLVALHQAHEGAEQVSTKSIFLGLVLRASRREILRTIIFPASLSWVLASMKLNIGVALMGAFIGEFISSARGLGYFMLRAGSLYDVNNVFAGGMYVIFLSIGLRCVVDFVEKHKIEVIRFFSVRVARPQKNI